MELRQTLNIIFGLVLVIEGAVPILSLLGVNISSPFSFFPSIVMIIIVLIAVVMLAVDGFGEEHFMKFFSLSTAFILALMVGLPILNGAGFIPFSLPGFITELMSYFHFAGGIFLIIGAFIYHG